MLQRIANANATTQQPARGNDWVAEVSDGTGRLSGRDYAGLTVRLGSGAAFHSPERSGSLRGSTDDYRQLLWVEAREIQFVETVERGIARKAADLARRRRGWR